MYVLVPVTAPPGQNVFMHCFLNHQQTFGNLIDSLHRLPRLTTLEFTTDGDLQPGDYVLYYSMLNIYKFQCHASF